MMVALGGVVIAETTPKETSYVSQSTTKSSDWEDSYGSSGYVILANSSNTFYSNMYQDYTGEELITGNRLNYGTVFKSGSSTDTGLKSDAIISRWGYNGGTWTACTNTGINDTTLYIPGTTTTTNARIHNSSSGPWHVGMMFTTTSETYMTVYIPKAYGGTISETTPLDVNLYNCYTTGQPDKADSINSYTNLVATARVTTNIGTYVTFYIKTAGDYTMLLTGDAVSSATLKPMIGGIFFDDIDPNSLIKDRVSYVLNDLTTDSDWEGTFGNDGYIIFNADFSNKDSSGNAIDPLINAYTKSIYEDAEGQKYDGQVYFSEYTHRDTKFELTAKEGYTVNGDIISRFGTATSTWRKQTIPHSLYKPGTQELTHTQVGGSAVSHIGQVAFTLTEQAFSSHDTIYVTVYNNMCNGYSEDAYNYTSYVYSEYYVAIDKFPSLLQAKHTIEVKSPRGFYVTYAITQPGDYSIYLANDNRLSLANVQGLFFDYTEPEAIKGTDVEPSTQVVPSNGSNTAEVVSVDRYTGQAWEGIYGNTAYVMPYSNANYWPSETRMGTVITKGIYSTDYEYTSGYCLGSSSSAGTFIREQEGALIPNAVLTKFALSGSVWRESGHTQSQTENGLYLPGTTNVNYTQLIPPSNNYSHGFSFCVAPEYDDVTLYVTAYVYANDGYALNPDFRVGLFNRYTSSTDNAISFFDTTKSTYKAPIASTIVKGASRGAYVTFAIKGAGTYTIVSLGGETTAMSVCRATTAGLFVDTQIPKYNVPNIALVNDDITKVDTYYGASGVIDKDSVQCDIFDNITNTSSTYSFDTSNSDYYYLSILVTSATKLDAYIKYYPDTDVDNVSDVYKVESFDFAQAGIYTLKIRDDITLVSDKDISIYVDTTQPVLYTPLTSAIDDWTGSAWEGVYGQDGYFIPYGKSAQGVKAYSSGVLQNANMDATWLKEYSTDKNLNEPTKTTIVSKLLMAQRGSIKIAIDVTNQATTYLTVGLMHYYPYSDIESAYLVKLYNGASLNTPATAIYTETVYNLDEIKYLTFNVEGPVCLEISLLTDEEGKTYGYMPSVLGVFADSESPTPAMSEVVVEADDNATVSIPDYIRVGESTNVQIFADRGYRIESIVIDGNTIDTNGETQMIVSYEFDDNVTIYVTTREIITLVDILSYDNDTDTLLCQVQMGVMREVVSYGVEINGVLYDSTDLVEGRYSMTISDDTLVFVRAYLIYDTGYSDIKIYSNYYVVMPTGELM